LGFTVQNPAKMTVKKGKPGYPGGENRGAENVDPQTRARRKKAHNNFKIGKRD